ncbi:hypothetical protein [Lactococcus lactis]|uniref:Uncharacterized protein n=2 Tax=Lactococcus lactis TaxID=1358 RepID=A0AAW7J7L8_9LACT|nr:hypothetical protein [Lactococcus lactis]KST76340.1 hypothetical protein ATCC19435_2518 [Lactococcus lactis subsp. lactis]MBU3885769.1 hypothetical protein [Lactococcus lactis]MCT0061795.1 hypothetical protein [Lactococcus lactis subsp. lactis]MCT0138239.1 hypothetical protein [Lactococcus lactis subsp. lactis]MCT3121399.1 hypothetical protein [Lactococcus lactis]
MFDGTSWLFKILYFLTAMSPAYFLFIFTQVKLGVLGSIGLFLIISLCTIPLKIMIEKSADEGVKTPKYEVTKIETKNGEIPSFLLGVILPSVIGGADNFIMNLIIFIVLQLCLFILMIKSSSILPNVLLIFMGLNIFEMEDGKYIFSSRKKLVEIDETTISITRLGDSNTCNTYVRKKE